MTECCDRRPGGSLLRAFCQLRAGPGPQTSGEPLLKCCIVRRGACHRSRSSASKEPSGEEIKYAVQSTVSNVFRPLCLSPRAARGSCLRLRAQPAIGSAATGTITGCTSAAAGFCRARLHPAGIKELRFCNLPVLDGVERGLGHVHTLIGHRPLGAGAVHRHGADKLIAVNERLAA